MSKYLVACDDGHGMETAGKRTPALKEDIKFRGKVYKKGSCIHENEFNENIMEIFIEGCKRCNLGTLQVAPGDGDTSLSTRVNTANSSGADLYVSFHANALTGKWQTGAYGLVVIHHKVCQQKTKDLANNIYDSLKNGVDWYSNGGTKYGVRKDTDISGYSLYVLKNTKMPAVLVEYGFMDNWEDVKRMCTDKFARDCAENTLRGVCKTLGVKYVEASSDNSNIPSNKIVRVTVDELNIRNGPGTSYSIVGCIKDKGSYTIVEKNGSWGKLKSLIGWINCSSKYVKEL